MNSYWSYKRSQNYRKLLQKKLLTNHSNRINLDEDFVKNVETISDVQSPIIQIKSVSFDIEKDGVAHRTGSYELMSDARPTPVYRRGQPFSVILHFNRDYKPEEDFFHLMTEFGPYPSLSNGTKYKIPLSEKQPESGDTWEMWTKGHEGSELDIQIQTPTNCQVGIWTFRLFTYKADTGGNLRFDFPEEIYILFNPWNDGDDVFLDNERERQDYVLNDHGTLFMGINKEPTAKPWVFGQFDAAVLPALALLLESSDVPPSHRGSPVYVSRAISAVVNSYDDDGLLEGKWEGEFDEGTKPFVWTGSVAFYEEYLQTGTSVKYAQCWVFSGAITTACRALGIPCRPVTCYVCAHDTNNSLTVDKFFTKSGTLIEGGADGDCYDSTWNFHCWNEVWMARPDLPPGYEGWQAIDGTPQEQSGNKYRTGPASLRAVKEGKLGFQYDTGFVFSEVNADVCHFQEDSNSAWGFSRIKLDSEHIGKRVVTLSAANMYGDRGMDEITHLYKHKEGSEEERAAVFNALKRHPTAQQYYKAVNTPAVRDVFFKLKEIHTVFVGDPFHVSLIIENHASSGRTVKVSMTATSVLYTGKTIGTIKESNMRVSLAAKEAKKVKVTVASEEYLKKIVNNCQLKVVAVASVDETGQTFTAEDDLELTKSKLDIKIPEDVVVGNISGVQFSFTNPFQEILTNCALTVEGPGLQRPKTVKLRNISPNGQIKHTESLVPKRGGPSVLVAVLNSDQLTNVRGSKNIDVKPKPK